MTQPRRAAGLPIFIGAGVPPQTLERLMLGADQFSEAWLQTLLFDHPELLPIGTIEPALLTAQSVACEVPCPHGFIDNVLVTPNGDIVIAEVKLWRNPQARRELVAQVLDYVAALSAMDYTAFEQALMKGQPGITGSLYAQFASHSAALSEAAFIDAVTTNLARGRILALAVGDGIRSEVVALASLLQGHAGAHFTFALVELGIWRDPKTAALLCLPQTLLQTVMVERGIVTLHNGGPQIIPVPASASVAPPPKSISSELFDEALAKKDGSLPCLLRAFLAQLTPLGVYTVQKASLHLEAQVPGRDAPIKLGYIVKNGQLWTDTVIANAPTAPALRYLEQLTEMVGGMLATTVTPTVTINGTSAPNVANILTDQADAWYQAIASFVRDCELFAQEGDR